MTRARSYIRFADSWHVLGKVPLDGWDTLCGRHVTLAERARMSDTLPLGEKSCESCLRLVMKREADASRLDELAAEAES